MPGKLLTLTATRAAGGAVHPRLPDYRVLVSVVHRSVIVHSVVADAMLPTELTDGLLIQCGFSLDLTRLDLGAEDIARLRFNIGETDEWIDPPEGARRPPGGRLTVEDILVGSHGPRSWVTGATYLDAAAAGLRVDTIIDMLYRDYLGRPSDPNGLAYYVGAVTGSVLTYDDIRRSFIESDEYRLRRKYVDNAPGSIFSQKIVMAAAANDSGQSSTPLTTGQTVVASELTSLDGAAFVTEIYRRILLKEPDEGGMAHYLHQLHLGMAKVAIIRHVANELEAITAGIRVIGYPPADTGPASSGVEAAAPAPASTDGVVAGDQAG